MSVLGGGNGSRPPVGPENDEDHQDIAGELIDAFADHDGAALGALAPAGRAAQVRARRALYDYINQIWQDAKARGVDPATRREWQVVAAMRDLSEALLEQAVRARLDAGEEDAP